MTDKMELLQAIVDADLNWRVSREMFGRYEARVSAELWLWFAPKKGWLRKRMVGVHQESPENFSRKFHQIYFGRHTLLEKIWSNVQESLKRQRNVADEAEQKRREQVEAELLRLLKGEKE